MRRAVNHVSDSEIETVQPSLVASAAYQAFVDSSADISYVHCSAGAVHLNQ